MQVIHRKKSVCRKLHGADIPTREQLRVIPAPPNRLPLSEGKMFNDGMNSGPDETVSEIHDVVHRFVQEQIAPRGSHIDEDNEFPTDLWAKSGEFGLNGVTASEEDDGITLRNG